MNERASNELPKPYVYLDESGNPQNAIGFVIPVDADTPSPPAWTTRFIVRAGVEAFAQYESEMSKRVERLKEDIVVRLKQHDELRTKPPASADPVADRLQYLAWCVPRSIREPFFGDLVEDLTDMRSKGLSTRAQWAAAISQILAVLVRLPVTRWLRGGQISK